MPAPPVVDVPGGPAPPVGVSGLRSWACSGVAAGVLRTLAGRTRNGVRKGGERVAFRCSRSLDRPAAKEPSATSLDRLATPANRLPATSPAECIREFKPALRRSPLASLRDLRPGGPPAEERDLRPGGPPAGERDLRPDGPPAEERDSRPGGPPAVRDLRPGGPPARVRSFVRSRAARSLARAHAAGVRPPLTPAASRPRRGHPSVGSPSS